MLLGELVPLALLAVLVARPIVYGLANFFEDFLRLLDPPGLFEQQSITGACFLARVISECCIFIKCSIRLPLQLEAPCIEQMAVRRGVTRIGLTQSFQRDLSFVRVASANNARASPSIRAGSVA